MVSGSWTVCRRGDPCDRMSAWLLSVRSLCALRSVHGGSITRYQPLASSALGPRWHVIRSLSASVGQGIKYEELKDLLNKDGVVLIDVREPWETKEYGIIKGSLNIPLGDLKSALKMSPVEFEEKYKMKMPDKSKTLVFSCLAGVRSSRALAVATSSGYNNIQHYAGGFDDWTRHEPAEKLA